MTNAELIKALRYCISDEYMEKGCLICPICAPRQGEMKCDSQDDAIKYAADALEAADKRIAELEDDLRNSTISNPERFKIYDYTVKDLLLFADMCKRNDVREADLKQAAWNLELAVRAVMNERAEIVKNTMDEITMRFTPDFEKAYEEMMPNCGARMQTVTECHTLEEGER